MRPEIDAALDQCLEDLRRGVPVKDCLDHYPEYAAQLGPLLETVIRVGRVLTPPASDEARAAGRERMLAALAQRRPPRRGKWWGAALMTLMRPRPLAPAWRLATLALVLCLVGGILAGAASVSALPGGTFYPLKAVARQVRLALIVDPARHDLVAQQVARSQRQDVAAALQAGRRARVAFRGTLEAIEEGQWTVGGLPVVLDPATVIRGQARVGGQVQVQGRLPGDGRLLAVRLEVETPSGPATPTATPQPRDTATATPLATVTPTVAPTATPGPTVTTPPQPTEELRETEEPEETGEAEGTDEPEEPEETGEAEGTDEPEEPEETGEPQATEEPKEPEETGEAEGTDEPEESNPTPTYEATPSRTPDDDEP